MLRLTDLRDARGTATLEMVVILPTVFLLFLGAMELSRLWFTLHVMTSAAREGARAAAVSPPNTFPGSAYTRMDQILTAANLTCAQPPCRSVNCSTSPCGLDATVVVEVRTRFTTVFPLLLPIPDTLDLVQTATMRYESS